MEKKVAVIGGGNMGGALIDGFLKSGRLAAANIAVADLSETTRKRFQDRGLRVSADGAEVAADADLVILAVKPWLVEQVAAGIVKSLKRDTLIISVAAGVSLESLQTYFGKDAVCFRVIPNIAAALGASMTFVACEERYNAQAQAVLDLFQTVGEAALIPEKLMDAAMVSGSCGTAYALRFLRAAMEAGIQMGLASGLSRTVVAQTMKGAAELLLNSDLHPEVAIDQVTTPGGVTIVGLNAMEREGFTGAVIEGHLAAYRHVKGK